jgi:hypothetical protein
MAYFNTCPRCGSNLDPGERCDCEAAGEQQDTIEVELELDGQYTIADIFGKHYRDNYIA